MRSTIWMKRASLAIALFVAGAVAGDLAVRGSQSAPGSEVASAPVQVAHKRKVRTVHTKPSANSSAGAPAATAAPSSVVTSGAS